MLLESFEGVYRGHIRPVCRFQEDDPCMPQFNTGHEQPKRPEEGQSYQILAKTYQHDPWVCLFT